MAAPYIEISKYMSGFYLGLLLTTELKVLAALQHSLHLVLANSAFHTKGDLLGSLGLLVEDGLGLTTVTGLLALVTTGTLGKLGGLTSLVLGDLVDGVLLALLTRAIGLAGLGDVYLREEMRI